MRFLIWYFSMHLSDRYWKLTTHIFEAIKCGYEDIIFVILSNHRYFRCNHTIQLCVVPQSNQSKLNFHIYCHAGRFRVRRCMVRMQQWSINACCCVHACMYVCVLTLHAIKLADYIFEHGKLSPNLGFDWIISETRKFNRCTDLSNIIFHPFSLSIRHLQWTDVWFNLLMIQKDGEILYIKSSDKNQRMKKENNQW